MNGNPASSVSRLYQVALSLAPGVGPFTARKLLDHYGTAMAVLEAGADELTRWKRENNLRIEKWNTRELLSEAEKELKYVYANGIEVLFLTDPEYPALLKECGDAPPILYSKGRIDLNATKCLSIVGTRRATSYGTELCMELVKGLAQQLSELTVVSGLAFGIDVIAHRAALEHGLKTVSVLGHGMTSLYPEQHRQVAEKIILQGALVTEFSSGTPPEKGLFVRRNRIIAGLSQGTLVIESAEKGGALLTAGMASSYHREVMALPGRAGDSMSEGCNRLIKSNLAALVESSGDVMNCLGWERDRKEEGSQANTFSGNSSLPLSNAVSTKVIRTVLQTIRSHPGSTPGFLSNTANIPLEKVLASLLELELQGWIFRDPGNRYQAARFPSPST